jgi:hypothetical protein
MHQAIGAALKAFETEVQPRLLEAEPLARRQVAGLD